MVGTADEGEQTQGGVETHGGQTVGPIGPSFEQAEGHTTGPCLRIEEGTCPGLELEESRIGILSINARLQKNSSSSGLASRKKDKTNWMNLPLIN